MARQFLLFVASGVAAVTFSVLLLSATGIYAMIVLAAAVNQVTGQLGNSSLLLFPAVALVVIGVGLLSAHRGSASRVDPLHGDDGTTKNVIPVRRGGGYRGPSPEPT